MAAVDAMSEEREGARVVAIPGGELLMGSDGPDAHPADGESPVRRVAVAPFRLAACAVTVAEFAAFVDATGHVTEAERWGWSFVFAGFLPEGAPPTRAVAAAPWWRQVEGATWRAPEGPGSSVAARADHPVVHVSWGDAAAYCAWAGGRLPTEPEWEWAARGGLVGKRFPWGDELEPGGEHRMNVWQGEFPSCDTGADGWRGTCPVDAFPPNGYGLHNMTGNAWEWVDGRFDAHALKVMRGGSHLCHASYCNRYRTSGRTGSTPDSTTGHCGLRVAFDA